MADTVPESRAESGVLPPQAIREQLERILDNPHFRNSRRFPSFLRFVVEQTLAGQTDLLKERTLGIEVFGKEADYDTSSDPIVRVTAAEIRKRIAQYYQEPGHEQEVQISLPSGSYVPQFQCPHNGHEPSPPAAAAAGEPARTEPEQPRRLLRVFVVVLLVAALVAGVAAWILLRPRPHPRSTALDLFWAPVLNSGESVSVCFPVSHYNGIQLRQAADPLQQKLLPEDMRAVVVDDLQPLVDLAGLLDTHHQNYLLVGADTSSLTDLRRGPAIFLGAFDNFWTLRMTSSLRYRFGNDPDMTRFWIEDTRSHTRWLVDRRLQEATDNYRDYALVARFQDPNTGQVAVVSAGIARGGTVAAGEFLTVPGDMQRILDRAPKNWAGMNMEFVLSTEIIDGRSAPPKIEATYFW